MTSTLDGGQFAALQAKAQSCGGVIPRKRGGVPIGGWVAQRFSFYLQRR